VGGGGGGGGGGEGREELGGERKEKVGKKRVGGGGIQGDLARDLDEQSESKSERGKASSSQPENTPA